MVSHACAASHKDRVPLLNHTGYTAKQDVNRVVAICAFFDVLWKTPLGHLIFRLQNQAAESEVTLVEGEVYAALFEEDERWYRGLVESLMNDDKVRKMFC